MSRRRGVLLVGVTLVLAHRLIIAGGGGSSFTVPLFESFTINSSPDGGWTQIPDPKAHQYDGVTYFDWVDGTNGNVVVGSVSGTSLTASTVVGSSLVDDGPTDNHNSGSTLVRSSDHRIVAAYAGHLDTRVRVRVSTNPEDASSFASEQVLNPGYGGVYTYCTLVELRDLPDTPLYLFVRSVPNTGSQVGRIVYAKSTDGGDSWSSFTVLFTGDTSPVLVPYWRIGTDWSSRIDFFTTDQQPAASTGLWHFYMDGTDDSVYQSDGTEIVAALPLEVDDLTLVLDDTDGSLWSWGASWDGAPATVIMQENGGSDNRILTARWRSGAWQVDEVVSSVNGQLGINKYGSGAAIDHADPDRVLVAIKVGSKFEMFLYVSPDDGATWSATQLTSGSSVDQVWPEFVHEYTPSLEAIWLSGTYTSDTSFSFGVTGYGRN